MPKMPGFDKSKIVGLSDGYLDEFLCGICFELFVKPVVTQCCRQTYCEDCIHSWLRDHNSCPNDRQSLTIRGLSPAPRVVVNVLNNMKVFCDFRSIGCQSVVPIRELPNHRMYCIWNPEKKCQNCGFTCDPNGEHNCTPNERNRLNEEILRLEAELKNSNKVDWIECSNGAIPAGALIGGEDVDGEVLYVGRALHNGLYIPGKIKPTHGVCYVSHDCLEHAHHEYQVLASVSKI